MEMDPGHVYGRLKQRRFLGFYGQMDWHRYEEDVKHKRGKATDKQSVFVAVDPLTANSIRRVDCRLMGGEPQARNTEKGRIRV